MEKGIQDILAKLVLQEVKNQVNKLAIARNRDEYINRLVEVLDPALTHYYKYTLAELNHKTDQVEKWKQQEGRFLNEFNDRFLERIKSKGFDRRKALEVAMEEIMASDEARRRIVERNFSLTYQPLEIRRIDPSSSALFWLEIKKTVDFLLDKNYFY